MDEDDAQYDVGCVTDCDNDRCVLIARDDETGTYVPLEEDYTFAVAVDDVLSGLPPGQTVVTNWSTSQMIKDICSSQHANLRRVPTGEVYTASDALHFHAAVAGEGSCAGVIDPRIGMGRDVLVAMWHVLSALARTGKSLGAITASYPHYRKENRDCRTSLSPEDTQAIIGKLQVQFAGQDDLAFMSREDGLIVAFQDHSRLQIRASNTEPVLRVRSVSPHPERAKQIVEDTLSMVRTFEQ